MMVHNVPDNVSVSEIVAAIREKIVRKRMSKQSESVRSLFDSKVSLSGHHH